MFVTIQWFINLKCTCKYWVDGSICHLKFPKIMLAHTVSEVGTFCIVLLSFFLDNTSIPVFVGTDLYMTNTEQKISGHVYSETLRNLHTCIKTKYGYFEHSLPYLTLNNMNILCLCASESSHYFCCKLPFVSVKWPTCDSLHKATCFYTVWCVHLEDMVEIFPAFNVANWGNCGQSFVKFCWLQLVIYSHK